MKEHLTLSVSVMYVNWDLTQIRVTVSTRIKNVTMRGWSNNPKSVSMFMTHLQQTHECQTAF